MFSLFQWNTYLALAAARAAQAMVLELMSTFPLRSPSSIPVCPAVCSSCIARRVLLVLCSSKRPAAVRVCMMQSCTCGLRLEAVPPLLLLSDPKFEGMLSQYFLPW